MCSPSRTFGKNFIKIYLIQYLRLIFAYFLDYQHNYVERLLKRQNFLQHILLSFLHNYFNILVKLFLYLYLSKFFKHFSKSAK